MAALPAAVVLRHLLLRRRLHHPHQVRVARHPSGRRPNGQVVGLIDIEIDVSAATIDSIAVHPDHQRGGIASRLLAAAIDELPDQVTTLDAWTREDHAALNWYQLQGFREAYRYLHVYKNGDSTDAGFTAPPPLAPPLLAFCHASIEHENELRSQFDRVYVCRQFLREVSR